MIDLNFQGLNLQYPRHKHDKGIMSAQFLSLDRLLSVEKLSSCDC